MLNPLHVLRLAVLLLCVLSQRVTAQQIVFVDGLKDLAENFQLGENFRFNGQTYFTTISGTDVVTMWRIENGNVYGIGQWQLIQKPGFGTYREFAPVIHDNRMWFAAQDSLHGIELWSSDGTAGGTQLFVDLCPGTKSGLSADEPRIALLNNRILVSARDSNNSGRLWYTGGTLADTGTVYDFPAPAGHYDGVHSLLPQLGNNVLFSATAHVSKSGLWTSDGSRGGTGRISPANFPSHDAIVCNGFVLANALSTAVGPIHYTNGTLAGTGRIPSNVGMSTNRCVAGNSLYFIAYDTMLTLSLYAVEGQTPTLRTVYSGLEVFANFGNRTMYDYGMLRLQPFGSKIVFSGDSCIYQSDGTRAGTSKLVCLQAAAYDQSGAPVLPRPAGLTAVGDQLYFKCVDSERVELFVHDGNGTRKIPMAGANYVVPRGTIPYAETGHLDPMFIADNNLYFTARYDNTIGKGLYRLELPLHVNAGTPLAGSLVLRPNPASNVVHIRLPEGDDWRIIRITDASGKVLHESGWNAGGSQAIDVSGWPPGMYVVTASGTTQTLGGTLVIQ